MIIFDASSKKEKLTTQKLRLYNAENNDHQVNNRFCYLEKGFCLQKPWIKIILTQKTSKSRKPKHKHYSSFRIVVLIGKRI